MGCPPHPGILPLVLPRLVHYLPGGAKQERARRVRRGRPIDVARADKVVGLQIKDIAPPPLCVGQLCLLLEHLLQPRVVQLAALSRPGASHLSPPQAEQVALGGGRVLSPVLTETNRCGAEQRRLRATEQVVEHAHVDVGQEERVGRHVKVQLKYIRVGRVPIRRGGARCSSLDFHLPTRVKAANVNLDVRLGGRLQGGDRILESLGSKAPQPHDADPQYHLVHVWLQLRQRLV